jgi:hypothetical protein
MNNCSLKLMVANCQCLTGFHVIYSQRHYCLLRSVPFVSRNWEKTTRFHNLVQILGQLGEPALQEYVEIMSEDLGGIGSRIFTSSYRPKRLWGPPSFLSNWYQGLFVIIIIIIYYYFIELKMGFYPVAIIHISHKISHHAQTKNHTKLHKQ